MANLIGCGSGCVGGTVVGCVVGAEKLTQAAGGVWVKTRFFRQGNFLCATVYSVAAGEPKIVELRIDLRPIARAVMRAHSALHAKTIAEAAIRRTVSGGTTVGWGLGSLWKKAKKAAKAIGRNKLVRGVVSVTKKIAKTAKTVIKSKITGIIATGLAAFPLTAPLGVAALGAYAAANAAVAGIENGAKVVKLAQGAVSTIRQGASLARRVTSANTQAKAAVEVAASTMSPASKLAAARRAAAAGKLALSPKGKAVVSNALAKAPLAKKAAVAAALRQKLQGVAQVRQQVALAKTLPAAASKAVLGATALQAKASPVISKAAQTAKLLQKPDLRAKLVKARETGVKATALLTNVANAAKGGSLDAQKSAVIVNLVARNRARIQAMSQANAGGLPGVLITRDGKLRRGRFRVQAVSDAGGVLFQGGTSRQRGSFTSVSGFERLVAGDVTLDSIAINGDLPMDGVRLAPRGPASADIGPYENVSGYELVGCGSSPCGPCSAAQPV